ncbi:hypothetical protein, conserved [Trypanosoma brucei brucei TREU927]|uniref:Uncharacterized protein n=1 Tax=Trypanosoma brucei brucei (strain 927/4 GUTat10.1) TaxID=185431 RepID=Q587C2_TRYB2|nr:hypothetical protein, conserved [Trypanosoma brucei brucei TREU927]AAX79255.1 hypothetical protein, conserved [Trypanosoma brucei]AAZ12014.1 hypothetical protein, conserved [Trypanosoma brucei brucei TREU927]
MRKFCHFMANCWNSARSHATYGAVPLTHSQVTSVYATDGGKVDELGLLELVEERIFSWKLNKWEMRIPPNLPNDQKELIRQEQENLKQILSGWRKCFGALNADILQISSLTGVPKEVVREKNRTWLQEEVAKLRWMGEVNKAALLRDAFMRLEAFGSRDFMFMERLCCIYGLARQGTFDEAFTNYITEDPVTNDIFVDERNPFKELVAHIVRNYSQIDIIYDFLGFNYSEGYRSSLRRYMEYLQCKTAENVRASGRLVTGDKGEHNILFDYCVSRESLVSGDSCQGIIDFLYINGNDVTLIIIASDNPWLRNRQLPHRRQMEGIARRVCFVLGIPPSEVRIRNLLLPPTYLDKGSIVRLNDIVFRLSNEQSNLLIPWLTNYNKELDPKDVDYTALAKTTNEEEWLTL